MAVTMRLDLYCIPMREVVGMKTMIIKASSKAPVLFAALFLCALFSFAKPVEVKANDRDLSGQKTTQEICAMIGNDANAIITLDGDTTITINSNLTIKEIRGNGHTLTITGESGKLTCSNMIVGGNVTISGNYDGNIFSDRVTITNGTINSGYIYNGSGDLTISGGKITFRQGDSNYKIHSQHKVVISGGQINIPESAITTDYGIRGVMDVEIRGENTYIDARNSAAGYSAICSTNGTVTIQEPLEITTPDGGQISNDNKDIVDSEGYKAHYVVIRGPQQPQPQPEETHESIPVYYYKKPVKDQDKGNEEEHSSKPVVVNPDTVEGFFAVNGQILPGVAMGKMKQGVAAQVAFNANRAVGWNEAFTFNIAINGKVDYTLKNGTLTFIIPKEYQKAGRTFAVMALDKNGKAWTFADIDTNPSTLTANINVEGYAFALIYKD